MARATRRDDRTGERTERDQANDSHAAEHADAPPARLPLSVSSTLAELELLPDQPRRLLGEPLEQIERSTPP